MRRAFFLAVLMPVFCATDVIAKEQSIGIYTGFGDADTTYLEPVSTENNGYSKPLWPIDYIRRSSKYAFGYGICAGRVPFKVPSGGGVNGQYQYADALIGFFSEPDVRLGAHMYIANGFARNEVHYVSRNCKPNKSTSTHSKVAVGLDINFIKTPVGPLTLVFELGSTDSSVKTETGHTSKSSFSLHGTQVMYGIRYWFGKEFRKK